MLAELIDLRLGQQSPTNTTRDNPKRAALGA